MLTSEEISKNLQKKDRVRLKKIDGYCPFFDNQNSPAQTQNNPAQQDGSPNAIKNARRLQKLLKKHPTVKIAQSCS